MLNQLLINNYALIDSAEIEFNSGFSVITGETGAGKSILLGALSLILGQRSDISAMRDKEHKCVVEAHFNIAGYGLETIFATEDVDYDNNTVIRREILPSGKSRAFVNDTPVTLNFLKDLTQGLIDIHSQHQNLLLGDYSFQLMVVDTVAKNSALKDEYKQAYSSLKDQYKKRSKLLELNAKLQADKDYWEFQVNQLLQASLKTGEQEELEHELQQLSHVEEIKEALTLSSNVLSQNEFPVLDGIHQVKTEIGKISEYLPGGIELTTRLESIYIELKDIIEEVETQVSEVEYDPNRLRFVQERLDLFYSLQQKHHVNSVDALITIQCDFQDKLSRIDSFDIEMEDLNKIIGQQEKVVFGIANKLSATRKDVFENICKTIEQQLHELGMPHARFQISLNKSETLRDDGIDEIQFLFTANKNGTLSDIPKVASGGEMSRVMLSIKSLLSSAKGLPTIIFDEIDTGISGEIADKMGRIMQQMGAYIQVISITHLPQIASKGNYHFKVYKSDAGHQTVSEIRKLTDDDRVNEIAGMLSGAGVTEAALINARELIGR